MHHTFLRHFFFFFNDTATTEIYTLSLHDALPIWPASVGCPFTPAAHTVSPTGIVSLPSISTAPAVTRVTRRSEEHTSELQSPCNLLCRLLLEKKKQQTS